MATSTKVRGLLAGAIALLGFPLACGGDEGDDGGGAVCQIGEINCAGSCVSLDTSADHCGECGNACPAPESGGRATCTDGTCGIECDSGFELCGTTCVDVTSDVDNCGGCDDACGDPGNGTVSCVDSACVVECDAGNENCSGTCANLLVDAEHCGACGDACGANDVCANGNCVTACPDGQTRCGSSCVNTSTDADHCGGCDNACPDPGDGTAACQGGSCSVSCTTGESCGDACVDTATDVENCGGCGQVCDATNGTPTCASSACSITCDADFGDCDGDASNGCEANLLTSTGHCGACGDACTGGQVCSAGTCAAGCGSLTDCSGTCTDTATDADHCGGCGTSCDPPITGGSTGSATCSSSACGASCSGGRAKCNTPDGIACVTSMTDPQACGNCDTQCGEGEKCVGGSCQMDARAPGLTNCGLGAVVNRDSNPDHCGSCNNDCGGGLAKGHCEEGKCTNACSSGKTECPAGGLDGDVACADLETDPANCGSCGERCDAGEVCAGGECRPFLYASGCWACGNGNDLGKCCTLGADTICVAAAAACP